MRLSRNRGGTETARPLDLGRLAAAMQREGIDPRHWASYGTVCTQRSDGTYDFEDPLAVAVAPGGTSVDVLLHPLTVHVTCRYPGMHGGPSATVAAPVKPGDEVLVSLPDGDLRLPPVIEKVMAGQHSPVPLDADGRTPLFKNDRVLIWSNGAKIQVRVTGGAEVVINPDGSAEVTGTKVTLGAPDAVQQLLLGTAYRDAEAEMNSTTTPTSNPADPGLQGVWTDAADACVGPLAPLKPFFLAAVLAIGKFEAKSGQFLSNVSKTK